MCLYDSIRDIIDSSFISGSLYLKKLVFELDDFERNESLKHQKAKPEQIQIICEILEIQIHVYSTNGNDPYFCDKYSNRGLIVNLWLADGHYQIIIKF